MRNITEFLKIIKIIVEKQSFTYHAPVAMCFLYEALYRNLVTFRLVNSTTNSKGSFDFLDLYLSRGLSE